VQRGEERIYPFYSLMAKVELHALGEYPLSLPCAANVTYEKLLIA
jgi:hypothetical protein